MMYTTADLKSNSARRVTEAIHFDYKTARYCLFLSDSLIRMPIPTLRTLFRYMSEGPADTNSVAIYKLAEFLLDQKNAAFASFEKIRVLLEQHKSCMGSAPQGDNLDTAELTLIKRVKILRQEYDRIKKINEHFTERMNIHVSE